ncbi:MAG: PriCT-2 domain-containing protein, partial [Ruminococcus sp.]|nr:PriCT-2 domain-containing protein [Ruminococcus sp.]
QSDGRGGNCMIDYSLLNAIPPDCSYDEWLKVGMALKQEGASCSVWDDWSRGGSKYKAGECERKWKSFQRDEVTGGTLFHIATRYGYTPEKDATTYDIHNLLLDEIIIDPSFVSEQKIPKVSDTYDAKGDMLEYFTTLFEEDDFVGYCTDFFQDNGGAWKPLKTQYRRTAGDIITKLRKGTIEKALGTLNEFAGAYVRFNPLDGNGENNANVTRWRYCLIESDTDSIERQYALLKE